MTEVQSMTEVEAILHAVEFLRWIFGAFGAVLLALFGIWWKVESGQNAHIDRLDVRNQVAHDLLHKRITSVKEELSKEMSDQHHQIRDRIEVVLMEIRK